MKKLQLLQAHIEQQERLMQRSGCGDGGAVSGGAVPSTNRCIAKRSWIWTWAIEETRRQWREARGKVVMLAIKAGNAPAAAALTVSTPAHTSS